MESDSLDVLSDAFSSNPFPAYEALRAQHPVCRVAPGGLWAISRYDDVQAALRDCDTFSSVGFLSRIFQQEWIKPECRIDLFIIEQDPPEHTRYRALVNKAFVTRVIQQVEPGIRAHARRLVEELRGRGEMEFFADFAYPYVARFIARFLGVDEHQTIDELRRYLELMEVIPLSRPEDALVQALEEAIDRQNAIYRRIIEARRRQPTDDLLSTLMRTEVEGEQLDDARLRSVLNLLLTAGLETTKAALCNAMHFLSRNPMVLQTLRADPAAVAPFVEEILRFNPPSHRLLRRTTRPVVVAGVEIPADAMVLLMIAAAQRDPARFAQPDEFIIHRDNAREHLAFGYGPHACIGAALARLQMRVALETLVAAVDVIRCPPEETLRWRQSLISHCVKELPLTLH